MTSVIDSQPRLVIPNLRSFRRTVETGELDATRTQRRLSFDVDITPQLDAWRAEQSVGIAADLLTGAVVAGQMDTPAVMEAAEFVKRNQAFSSPSLTDTANRILGRRSEGINSTVPRIEEFLDETNRERIHRRIRELRAARTRLLDAPIAYTELARMYLITANKEQAAKNIQIALALAPNNRFVLRAAVRVYVHLEDHERAFNLLHRNSTIQADPWLMSAKLATAGLVKKEKLVLREAMALATADHSALSLAELRAGLASIELLNGNRRKSRQLFEAAVVRPNDNALAQTEWALSQDRLFEFEPKRFDVKFNFEALALEAFNQSDWKTVIRHCESWFMDSPFGKRAAMTASHVATVAMEDPKTAISFCEAALLSHPRDPLLSNNLAYAQALSGDCHLAQVTLDSADMSDVAETTRTCITATRGLIAFRLGRVEEGRRLYLNAIELARPLKGSGLYHLALLHYVREQLLAGEAPSEKIVTTMKKQTTGSTPTTFKLLEKKVQELLEPGPPN